MHGQNHIKIIIIIIIIIDLVCYFVFHSHENILNPKFNGGEWALKYYSLGATKTEILPCILRPVRRNK